MSSPKQPVNLTPEQIVELNRKLSHMRHDINNHLTMVVAAAELMRFQPESTPQRVKSIMEQVPKVSSAMQEFSREFEKALGIERK